MRRLLKVAEAIRSVVGMAILTELRDPRVQNVTVTGVSVAPDLKSAKVRVSVMGDVRAQQLALKGLQNSAGFLQKRIAERIEMRWTPKLAFELDEGVKRSIEVARILQEVLPRSEDADDEDAWDEDDASEGEESPGDDPRAVEARADDALPGPAGRPDPGSRPTGVDPTDAGASDPPDRDPSPG